MNEGDGVPEVGRRRLYGGWGALSRSGALAVNWGGGQRGCGWGLPLWGHLMGGHRGRRHGRWGDFVPPLRGMRPMAAGPMGHTVPVGQTPPLWVPNHPYESHPIPMGPTPFSWVQPPPMGPTPFLWVPLHPYGSNPPLWVPLCPYGSHPIPTGPAPPYGCYSVPMGPAPSLWVPPHPYGSHSILMGPTPPMGPTLSLWVPPHSYGSHSILTAPTPPPGPPPSLRVPRCPYPSHPPHGGHVPFSAVKFSQILSTSRGS